MTAVTAMRVVPAPTTPTPAERRAALLELAEQVDAGDRGPKVSPFSPVLSLLVPPLASAACRDAMGCFLGLVGAVHEFSRFTSNEADWLAAHDLPDSAEVRANQHEALQTDVDLWLDRLQGRQS